MSDSRLVLKQRQVIEAMSHQMRQLEEFARGLMEANEVAVSVACAWTWDRVFGNPDPTDDEVKALYRENLKNVKGAS